jgi:hypothetical protein
MGIVALQVLKPSTSDPCDPCDPWSTPLMFGRGAHSCAPAVHLSVNHYLAFALNRFESFLLTSAMS